MAIFIPEDKISEIRSSANIVDIVSSAVSLKKTGRNYVGLCPFHLEKTPSFTVSPEKQIFYCFGCGAGGDVFSFLIKQDGLSFPEAARMLARQYGIKIPTQMMSPDQKRRVDEKESLLAINNQAMNFFHNTLLNSVAGKKAMEYLGKRGITREIINSFSLGYAPEGWDNLVNFFLKIGKSPATVEKSGLVVPRKEKDGFYDRFRGRIVFPIFDVNMKVIGFGGRVMDNSPPKYLNSPETLLYNKSRSLYGLHKAKGDCRTSKTVYIVEGYFDLLALHQHGIQNSVATLGTSLTSEHVQIIRGFVGKSGKTVLVYDSDDAGMKAAERSIQIFDKGYMNAQILVLPAGYDPDSYLFEFGSKSFTEAAAGALTAMSFLIESAVKEHGLSTEGKIHIISDMKGHLVNVNDNVARSLYIKELAERVGIDEAVILEEVRKTSTRKSGKAKWSKNVSLKDLHKTDTPNVIRKRTVSGKLGRLEMQIVAMMLQFPEILPEITERNLLEHFEDDTLKWIGKTVLKHKWLSGSRVSEILTMIDDKEKRSIAAFLAIGEDFWNREGCLKLMEQFESSRNRYKDTLLQKIRAAEECNDQKLLLKLLREKQIRAGKRA